MRTFLDIEDDVLRAAKDLARCMERLEKRQPAPTTSSGPTTSITRWERTPWRATQRAAWEALGRTWTAVSRGTESG
jgi:hypothetical protein